MGRLLAYIWFMHAGMLSLHLRPAGRLPEGYRPAAPTVPAYVRAMATLEAICRFERWPVYRLMIEEMVERGQPPKLFNEHQPWASIIVMAAQDEN